MKSFPDGHYLTPSVFIDSATAKTGLQLPAKIPPISDAERARYRITVDTADVADDIYIPIGQDHANGGVPRLSSEPIVSDNPTAGVATGGHPQFITPKELKIKEVYDTALGRFLDVSEWP